MLKRLLACLICGTFIFSVAAAQSTSDPLAIDAKHQKDIDNDIKQGADYAKQVEDHEKLSKDQDMQDRVKKIGAVMADIANHTHLIASWGDKRFSKYSYEFKVLQGKDVNAFSLPGGHVYVYEGLMKFVQSDDELAAVLGHEITHAALRHVATLQKEAANIQLASLPVVLATIFAGSRVGSALPAVSLINQSSMSGWSLKAETAADYGGFQLMSRSPYNPTACLTVNERLLQLEQSNPEDSMDYGIFATHPPSVHRVEAMLADLRKANLPIQRSAVTTSYTTTLKKVDDGIQAWFNNKLIYTFSGDDAEVRAEQAKKKLNAFFDAVPALYDVRANGEDVLGSDKVLFSIEQSDAAKQKLSVTALSSKAVASIQGALYNLTYQVHSAE